jgi:poly(A) polymerase Pap1
MTVFLMKFLRYYAAARSDDQLRLWAGNQENFWQIIIQKVRLVKINLDKPFPRGFPFLFKIMA